MWPVNRPEAIRITALNAAVEFVKTCSGVNPIGVIDTAAIFEEYIVRGKQ